MLPYKRSKRVADLLKEEISDIILRRLKDPRLGFVTVVDVSVTDDLRLARVYVSSLKQEERDQMIEILKSAKHFIRQELGRRVKLKAIPDLEFYVDTTIEYGSRIDKLLKEIKGE
ncbi:MAG: 30S ribosome-binding factor RbfA [Nitrospiraceae bacterium]|nr:30S ribosome-binding factor RbfA [Nitrospiraceae bacterium]